VLTKRLPTSDNAGPSSLTEEQIEAVGGGKVLGDKLTTLAIGEEGPPITTMMVGEDGPVATTMMVGEEDKECR
jgi:hypothetical protein